MNRILGAAFGFVAGPAMALSPWAAMALASALCAAAVLAVMRLCSRPEAVRAARGRVTAHLLEFVLYRHDPIENLASFGRATAANLRYLRALAAAAVLSLIPVALTAVHLAAWFDRDPVRPGEPFLMTVTLDPALPVLAGGWRIETGPGVVVDSAPLRDAAANEITWRLRATKPGAGWVDVIAGGERARKAVLAADGKSAALAGSRVRASGFAALAAAVEAPLPRDGAIRRISIGYPAGRLAVGPMRVHWAVAFLALAFAFALALKRAAGVEI